MSTNLRKHLHGLRQLLQTCRYGSLYEPSFLQIRSYMSSPTAFKPLIKEDIASTLNISLRCVDKWIQDGILLPPVKIGGKAYWHPDAFYEWLEQALREKHSTKSPSVDITSGITAGAEAPHAPQSSIQMGCALKEQTLLRQRESKVLARLISS